MRNLLSGIFGICFGLLVVCGGTVSGNHNRGGAYGAGATAGMICGGVFFLAGIPYLILGIMEMVGNAQARRPRRSRRRKPPKETVTKTSVSSTEVTAKADATKAILKLLAETDEWFDPARLKGIVEKLFVMFQEGWEQNDFQPLGKYVASTCLDKYLDRYENDAKRLKMAKLDDLELTRIRFIHVEAYGDFETHTFTAYLEASGPEKYKECWTFIRTPKRWKLEQMKPIGSSTAVSQLNEVPAELLAELEAEEGNDDLLAYIARG